LNLSSVAPVPTLVSPSVVLMDCCSSHHSGCCMSKSSLTARLLYSIYLWPRLSYVSYGTIASGVQTSPMSIEVNGEHLGGVRSFTAPLGREMPLADLLGLWGPQTRTGAGLITQRTGGPTDIADLEICGKVTPMEYKTACKVATTGLHGPECAQV
jgi:hypothetical protein